MKGTFDIVDRIVKIVCRVGIKLYGKEFIEPLNGICLIIIQEARLCYDNDFSKMLACF